MICIADENWTLYNWLEFLHFDEYFYSSNQKAFNQYVRDCVYCDCEGQLYCAVSLIPPKGWRVFFRFLPNVYRQKIIYEKVDQKMTQEELRAYLLQKLEAVDYEGFGDDAKLELMENVSKAANYEDLILAV